MSLFSSFFGPNINELAAQARDTPGSIVIDVRTPDEYREGHIEGALSVPLVSVPRHRRAAPAQQERTHLRLLPLRRAQRPGVSRARASGLHQRRQHGRHRQLERSSGALTRSHAPACEHGVELLLNANVTGFAEHDGLVATSLADGRIIESDMVIAGRRATAARASSL